MSNSFLHKLDITLFAIFENAIENDIKPALSNLITDNMNHVKMVNTVEHQTRSRSKKVN